MECKPPFLKLFLIAALADTIARIQGDVGAAFPAAAALGTQIVDEQFIDFVSNVELFF